MFSWRDILEIQKPPRLAELEVSCKPVAHDVKGLGVYADIVQIDTTMFAAVNQRFSPGGQADALVTTFYWAQSVGALLRAAYGCMEQPVDDFGQPPDELLLAPGCLTYSGIRAAAATRLLECPRRLVRAQSLSPQPYSGMLLRLANVEYYFICGAEDWPEVRQWDREPIAAIAVRMRAQLPRLATTRQVIGFL